MASSTLRLDDETFQKLIAARQAGVTPERLAEMTLESLLRGSGDHHWADRAPAGIAEPGRTWTKEAVVAGLSSHAAERPSTPEDYQGPFVDLDETFEGFSAELSRRLNTPAD